MEIYGPCQGNGLQGRRTRGSCPAKGPPQQRCLGGVELEDEEARAVTYQIVGEDEVEPNEGRISWK